MKKEIFSGGIRFECQSSGKCCTSRGSYGYVYLAPKDRKRFAEYFKIGVSEFVREFCEKDDGYTYLKNPGADCRFLDGKRCGVYDARPEQCRTWPFWPENMNAKGWSKEVASFCPGIGKGKLYTPEAIQLILNQKRVADSSD